MLIEELPPTPPSEDDIIELLDEDVPPGFLKKRRGANKVLYFEGTLIFRSPEAEQNFKDLHEACLTLKEPTKFKVLGHKKLEKLLRFNGLDKYIENVEQIEIFDKEVSQFYANLVYSKHDSSLSTRVKKLEMDVSKELLARWGSFPSEGICIHLSQSLDSLPFTCTPQ